MWAWRSEMAIGEQLGLKFSKLDRMGMFRFVGLDIGEEAAQASQFLALTHQ